MYKAKNKMGDWVWAKDASHGNEYFCPECGEPLSPITDSAHYQPFYRHHPSSTCGLGGAESVAHDYAKNSLAAALAQVLGDSNVAVEYSIAGHRPDVYFQLPEQDRGVALEVQYSQIGPDALLDRTAFYADRDIGVLWLTGGISKHLRQADMTTRSGLTMLPPWMARIADMFENYGFEPPRGDLTRGPIVPRIGLSAPVQKTEKIGDQWVAYWDWPETEVNIATGEFYETKDHKGKKRLLWYPYPIDGSGATRPRRRQTKTAREFSDDIASEVDCLRTADGILIAGQPLAPELPLSSPFLQSRSGVTLPPPPPVRETQTRRRRPPQPVYGRPVSEMVDLPEDRWKDFAKYQEAHDYVAPLREDYRVSIWHDDEINRYMVTAPD